MIYTREECKKLIIELEIINFNLTPIRVSKSKITSELLESILFHTNNCRDRLSERIYWILNGIIDYPICQECGTQFKPRFYGFKTDTSNRRFCSPKCFANNEDVSNKKKETCLNKFGTEYGWQSEEVKNKLKNTWLKNHNVINPGQCPIIKGKIKQTCLKNHNVEYSFQSDIVKEKSRKTNLKKLGVENVMQALEIQEKAMQTNMINFGVAHVMQNKDIFLKQQKSARKKKKLISPSGIEIIYQGYENVAYFKLLQDGYLEEQIVTDNKLIPSFKYFFQKERTYYPDIYIPYENKIIEVKSIWTYNKNLEQNLSKKQACLDQGYLFEFWICSNKQLLSIL
jgi:hypothetical protein